ncbi:MAG: T9SS type A sorting domain-containing protein [bacterium]|nr:T9SS type A sorting domain-containing protein [bacterium]
MLPYSSTVKTTGIKRLCATVALTLVCSLPALADKTDFLVNDDGSRTEQKNPRIAVAGESGFVIAWVDSRDGSSDIYLQRYDIEGAALEANVRVNDDTAGAYQSELALAVDRTGLYSCVWKDYRNSEYPFDPDLFFQRFDTALSPVGANFDMTGAAPGAFKETPDIALSPWGGGMLVWADYRNSNWDIYAQMITAGGALVGSNFKVNTDVGSAQQHAPRVAVSPEGWFAVTWYDNRRGNDDIYAQRYDSLANPLGNNLKINSDVTDVRQAFPDVATDGAGHFTVVWVDWRHGAYPSNPDIYARKFDTNLVAVTGDMRVNKDGTVRAQRQPSIAADRRGNVAIIWADSTASSWDIVGQMIDVEGVIREANFQANTDGDSSQLHPDVALDGRYRYITWSDKRNGDFDIYASIAKYNDPTLIPSPASMQFEMLEGDPAPPNQTLEIDHAGYNPIRFELITSADWLSAAPTSGVTLAEVSVSITTDTLPFGTYYGFLTLFDLDNDDSSMVVTVRLDVTAPIIELSEDTLQYRAFAGINDSTSKQLAIANAGAGALVWSAIETAPWLRLSSYSDLDETSVEVWASAYNLTAGSYAEPIIITAPEAANNPETTWAVIDVYDDVPYILLEPDSIKISASYPIDVDYLTVVSNAGVGTLNWTAGVNNPWLQLDRNSGTDGDTIHLTIDTAGLSSGYHETWVEIVDNAAFNPVERLPFILEYLLSSNDTVIFGSEQIPANGSGFLPVELVLTSSVRTVFLPIAFDPNLITIDSVVLDSGLAPLLGVETETDTIAGIFILKMDRSVSDTSLTPGRYNAAEIHFSGRGQGGFFVVDKPNLEGLSPYLVDVSDVWLLPSVVPGDIRVDSPTAVGDDGDSNLPIEYALSQNYPNPFNPSTVIEFQLPSKAVVDIEVFNVLGQKVRSLVSRPLPAGQHSVVWEGRLTGGNAAPTGVYFYRLRTAETSLTRKMLLIK